MNIKNKIFFSLVFFTCSLYFILLLYPLSQQGMFLDGVIYAAISKNMALGIGSIWEPFYSKTLFPHFFEHPSLAIFLQSLYFKLLGQGFWVERLYSLTMALLQIGLVIYLYFKEQKVNKFSLIILLLLWVLIPLNVSTYKNNMLEMTATFFSVLSACVLILYAPKNTKGYFFYLSLSVLLMLLGFLSNGATALYPLSIPLLQSFVYKKESYKKGMLITVILLLLGIIYTYVFFVFQPGAKHNLQQYISKQLLSSISGNSNLVFAGFQHLNILILFFKAYWPITVLACVLLIGQIKKQGIHFVMNESLSKKTTFYFLLALLSSLPVGISHRQSFHYIAQSAPFYLLAIMHFIQPALQDLMNNISMTVRTSSIIFISSFVLVISSASLVIYQAGGAYRQGDILHDVKVVAAYLPKGEIIDVSDPIYFEWDLAAYFARNSFISLSNTHKQTFYITLKNRSPSPVYRKVPLGLLHYDLWKR